MNTCDHLRQVVTRAILALKAACGGEKLAADAEKVGASRLAAAAGEVSVTPSDQQCATLEGLPREREPGRLAATGFAFGDAPWRSGLGLASPRTPAGPVLVVGGRKPREAALLAAMADYPGSVILIDHTGLADRLARSPQVRFAPGASAAIRHDPLASVRLGLDAWRDLVGLACALCGDTDDPTTEGIAAILADHLIAAPMEQRSLADLRRRLFDPIEPIRSVLLGYTRPHPPELAPLLAELARIRAAWFDQPIAAPTAVAQLGAALISLADGRLAAATAARDLEFADLVCADAPMTLVLSPPIGLEGEAAPILSAILSQALAAIVEAQSQTRPIQHRLALVIPDTEAFTAPPLLRQLWADLDRCGIDILVGAERPIAYHSFLGASAVARLTERDHLFASIVVAGAVDSESADWVSARTGEASRFGRVCPGEAGLSVFGWGWRKRQRIAPERFERA